VAGGYQIMGSTPAPPERRTEVPSGGGWGMRAVAWSLVVVLSLLGVLSGCGENKPTGPAALGSGPAPTKGRNAARGTGELPPVTAPPK
jgi:hypothetical protein